MKPASLRTVRFSDFQDRSIGAGIQIDFLDEAGLMVHQEFMGDADYNGAIVDWILFGTYTPEDRYQ